MVCTRHQDIDNLDVGNVDVRPPNMHKTSALKRKTEEGRQVGGWTTSGVQAAEERQAHTQEKDGGASSSATGSGGIML